MHKGAWGSHVRWSLYSCLSANSSTARVRLRFHLWGGIVQKYIVCNQSLRHRVGLSSKVQGPMPVV